MSYATLTDYDKKHVKEEYSASTRPPAGSPSTQILVVNVQRDNVHVLANDTPLLPMPIAISSNLPHVQFQLGPTSNNPGSPIVGMAVYTCAALTTGSIYYLLALAKQFPHCINKVFGPKE